MTETTSTPAPWYRPMLPRSPEEPHRASTFAGAPVHVAAILLVALVAVTVITSRGPAAFASPRISSTSG